MKLRALFDLFFSIWPTKEVRSLRDISLLGKRHKRKQRPFKKKKCETKRPMSKVLVLTFGLIRFPNMRSIHGTPKFFKGYNLQFLYFFTSLIVFEIF